MTAIGYRLALANRIEKGRAVGNLYGVSVTVNGAHRYYLLEPQRDESLAVYVWETVTGRKLQTSCEARWNPREGTCRRAEPGTAACSDSRFDQWAQAVIGETLDCDQILAGPEKDPLGGNVCEGR